jgi:hypothetical protein
MQQINVNGQNYSRWEDVPADVRQQLLAVLPDADKNGVPDLFETGALPANLPAGAQTFASTSIVVNGQPVSSLDQLPPEVRETLHQVFGWASPVMGAPPAPGAPAPPGTPPPPNPSWPLPPGQVMLNGVPTDVSETTQPRKSWWRRLFGG